MLSKREFQAAIDTAFAWLVDRGFRTTVRSFGLLGYVATLTDKRRWLRLQWETRDSGIFLSWGDYLPPGQFNDDPFRNPRPLHELVADPRSQIEVAGAVRGTGEAVGSALQRLSKLVFDSGAVALLN